MFKSSLLVEETRDQLQCPRLGVTIGELHDDVLLEIFSFCLHPQHDSEDAWHALVHVCRRWRHLVFASPRRLRLRLLCMPESPVKQALGIWPELPIAIRGLYDVPWELPLDNIIAALEQRDRVCEIHLGGFPHSLKAICSEMKKPFPSLVYLKIVPQTRMGMMLPDSFLGGSAPRLQSLEFYGILCPEIGKLLLSTRNLVFLRLSLLPRSGRGYTSPEAMVDGLSVLTRLKSLRLEFDQRTCRSLSRQASGHPPSFARVVLPALADINFYSDQEYMEDFVSRIDTPLLTNITISFLNRSAFVTSPLRDFISRTETFGPCFKMDIDSSGDLAEIKFFRRDVHGD